jgi:hypothetical protein
MDFPNVTDVGLNPSAMVGVRRRAWRRSGAAPGLALARVRACHRRSEGPSAQPANAGLIADLHAAASGGPRRGLAHGR